VRLIVGITITSPSSLFGMIDAQSLLVIKETEERTSVFPHGSLSSQTNTRVGVCMNRIRLYGGMQCAVEQTSTSVIG